MGKKLFLIISIFFIIATLVFVGILIYRLDTFFFLTELRDYTQNWLDDKFGLHIHKHLISALAIPLAAGLYYVIENIISKDSKKRWKGIKLYSGFLFLAYLSLFFIEKQWTFDPVTGESLSCFTTLPNGQIKKLDCQYNYDPIFGTKVIKANPSLVARYEAQRENPEIKEIKTIKVDENTRVVDNDGNPLVWYYKNENDEIEFYNHPGNHPQLAGIKLEPVTPEIINLFFTYLEKGRKDLIKDNDVEAINTITNEYSLGDGIENTMNNLNVD